MSDVEQRLADVERRLDEIERRSRTEKARLERVAAIGRIAADCAGVKHRWRPKPHHIIAAVTVAVALIAALDFLLRSGIR